MFLNNKYWKAFMASNLCGTAVAGLTIIYRQQRQQHSKAIKVVEEDAKFWKEAYESVHKDFKNFLKKDIELTRKRNQEIEDQIFETEYFLHPQL